MSFDAYHAWLGIPPNEQPPSPQRLLGIGPFETDPNVISHAADQRILFLRTMQLSEHATDAERLLNEISRARLALLADAGAAQSHAADDDDDGLQLDEAPTEPTEEWESRIEELRATLVDASTDGNGDPAPLPFEQPVMQASESLANLPAPQQSRELVVRPAQPQPCAIEVSRLHWRTLQPMLDEENKGRRRRKVLAITAAWVLGIFLFVLAVFALDAKLSSDSRESRARESNDRAQATLSGTTTSPPDESPYSRQLAAAMAKARGYVDQKDYPAAISAYSELIRAFGPVEELLVPRAHVLYITGAFDEAIDDCGRVIQSNTGSAGAYFIRGLSYAEKGLPARAITELDRAMQLDESLAGTCCFVKGKQYVLQNNTEKAISEFSRVIALDPLNEEALYQRGLAYLELDHSPELQALLDEYASLKSQHLQALSGRDHLERTLPAENRMDYWLSGKRELDRLRAEVWSLGLKVFALKVRLPAAYRADHRTAMARADFEEVLRLRPSHPGAKEQIEDLRRKMGY